VHLYFLGPVGPELGLALGEALGPGEVNDVEHKDLRSQATFPLRPDPPGSGRRGEIEWGEITDIKREGRRRKAGEREAGRRKAGRRGTNLCCF